MKATYNPLIRLAIIAILSLFSFTCQAQTKETKKVKEAIWPTKKSIVKLNLVSAVDIFVFPTIQFSYERKLSKRISLAGEFGYQFYQMPDRKLDLTHNYSGKFTTNSDTSFISPRGIKANIECRYYFLRHQRSKKNGLGFYAAANLSYRWNQTDISVIYLKDSITPTIDCYWMRRTYWGGMAVIGTQFIVGKVAVELYTGIGATARTVFNHNREYDKDRDEIQRNIHGFGAEQKFLSEYNWGTIAFNAGLRIGIAF